MLIGNHDTQYLLRIIAQVAQPELSLLFTRHAYLFQIAYQQRNYLFTHAGITNKWLTHFLAKTGIDSLTRTTDYNLAGLLNEIHQSVSYRNLLFDVGPKRRDSDAFSGPVWADRTETSFDFLTGFRPVVGHTPVRYFTTIGDKNSSITYTDVLQTKTAFYEVIIPD